MTDFNLVTDAKLSKAVYDSNNNSNTTIIDGWVPVQVNLGKYTPSITFGAQLYTQDGQYKVVYRGTEGNLSDWAVNKDYGLSVWTQQVIGDRPQLIDVYYQ
jgi:hypothetical protein